MSSFYDKVRIPVVLLMMSVALMFVSSCEDGLDGSSDIVMDSQKVGYEAGRQAISVRASGKWTLTLFFPEGEAWAELSTTSGTGNKDGIAITYGENKGNESRMVRIILTNKGMDAVRTFQQSSKSVSESESKGIPQWLELPAIGTGLTYHNHHFKSGGKNVRNYSFVWDKNNLVAHWVAYPLCKFYTNGNVGRTEAWNYDPSVRTSDQPNMHRGLGSINGTHCDRGHQIPSADRQCVRQANEQTYYYTNMTPQFGKQFNQGIWAALEGRVRTYSDSSDTLYVVTGCTLQGSPGKLGDNDGKKITVPGGYFKALLRYKKGTGRNGYMATAFFLDHKNYSNKQITSSMMMSIEELERKTGIDFFPNLINKIGKTAAADVESEDPHNVSFWGIN